MMELKSVGVLSCGKIVGALGVLTGLIVGIFTLFALNAAQNLQFQGPNGEVVNFPAGAAAGAGIGILIMAPITYGIMGFVGGIIYGFVYNLLASTVGGIEMHFERVGERYEPQDTYS